jgi:aminoglycoside 3-N-acetyltransferase
MVHSSLSNCGHLLNGADAIIDQLSAIAETLVMPTHTYFYPADDGGPAPVFSAQDSPSMNGYLTERFRLRRGSLRSIHSTHSLAAAGLGANKLISGHSHCMTSCGAGTPYSRLIEARAGVLMFGVSFHSYTLFHTAEDAAGSDCAYEAGRTDELRVLDEVGMVQSCLSKRQSRNPRRFKEVGELLEKNKLVQRVTLGRGHLLFAPDCAKVHDFLVERITRTPDYLLADCALPLE